MEPHAIVAAWDGDRLSIDTPSQGLAMAQGAHRRPVRHPAREHPYPQPVPRRRLRLEGASCPARRSSASWRPGSSAGRSSWCCAASRCTARSATARRRVRRLRLGADGEGALTALDHHTQDRVEHLRRFLRTGGRRLAHALCQPGDRDVARGRAARHRHAAVHARAGRGDGLDRAGKRHRRDGAGLRHGSAGVPPEELCRGRADLRQAVLVQGAARMLRSRAPSASAGRSGRCSRGRCATRPACWSAGAWAPRRSRR